MQTPLVYGEHLYGCADQGILSCYNAVTGEQVYKNRIGPGGTGFITDLGMTGPYDSVLGRTKENVLSALINAVPSPFSVASGDVRLCGIIADVEPTTGRCTALERVCVREDEA